MGEKNTNIQPSMHLLRRCVLLTFKLNYLPSLFILHMDIFKKHIIFWNEIPNCLVLATKPSKMLKPL